MLDLLKTLLIGFTVLVAYAALVWLWYPLALVPVVVIVCASQAINKAMDQPHQGPEFEHVGLGAEIHTDLLPDDPVVNRLNDVVEAREHDPHNDHPGAGPRKGVFLFWARGSYSGF